MINPNKLLDALEADLMKSKKDFDNACHGGSEIGQTIHDIKVKLCEKYLKLLRESPPRQEGALEAERLKLSIIRGNSHLFEPEEEEEQAAKVMAMARGETEGAAEKLKALAKGLQLENIDTLVTQTPDTLYQIGQAIAMASGDTEAARNAGNRMVERIFAEAAEEAGAQAVDLEAAQMVEVLREAALDIRDFSKARPLDAFTYRKAATIIERLGRLRGQGNPTKPHPAMLALEGLTPGGSEYVGDIPRCLQYVRDVIDSKHRMIVQLMREKKAGGQGNPQGTEEAKGRDWFLMDLAGSKYAYPVPQYNDRIKRDMISGQIHVREVVGSPLVVPKLCKCGHNGGAHSYGERSYCKACKCEAWEPVEGQGNGLDVEGAN